MVIATRWQDWDARDAATANTPAPSRSSPSDTPSSPASVGEEGVEPDQTEFTDRVLAFEQAYNQLDPATRYQAVAEFAHANYMLGITASDDPVLAEMRRGMSIEFDDDGDVTVEDIDATTREVNSLVRFNIIRDGAVVNTVTREHDTYWILVDNEWMVHSDVAP